MLAIRATYLELEIEKMNNKTIIFYFLIQKMKILQTSVSISNIYYKRVKEHLGVLNKEKDICNVILVGKMYGNSIIIRGFTETSIMNVIEKIQNLCH